MINSIPDLTNTLLILIDAISVRPNLVSLAVRERGRKSEVRAGAGWGRVRVY